MPKDDLKREMMRHVGPGGMQCPCCAPPPALRRASVRAARRRLKAADRRMFAEYGGGR